jgi:adenine-specific DNA-methyltransferase
LCDEVFGRSNYIATAVWQKVLSVKNSTRHFSVDHDYILVYAREADKWEPNQVPAGRKQVASYKNPDNDPRGDWQSISLSARNPYSKGIYPIRCPGGRLISGPPAGSYWRVAEEKFWELDRNGEIWWGKDRNGMPRRKMYRSDQGTLTKAPQTIWFYEDVGHTQDAKKEVIAINSDDVFPTPKPERLMKRIIEIGSNAGDLILDSFAGSGTTGAVAHKMGRRWVMVELGKHCQTHIVPRLRNVVDGIDRGGVTETLGWKGGGGFRYYQLAPSLLAKDKFGNWIISRHYNPAMLAEAMCKFEGFNYAPSDTEYWIHGHSTEQDFIYVTTQTLTREQLQKLSDEVGENRSLLVCCSAFRVKDVSQFGNLTIKKIPKMVLNRCEWGRDDYSLEVKSLPEAPAAAPEPASVAPTNVRRKTSNGSMNLFEAAAEENHSR